MIRAAVSLLIIALVVVSAWAWLAASGVLGDRQRAVAIATTPRPVLEPKGERGERQNPADSLRAQEYRAQRYR